jgi:hypothetical protein
MEYKLGNSQEKDITLNHLSCQNWTVKLLPSYPHLYLKNTWL